MNYFLLFSNKLMYPSVGCTKHPGDFKYCKEHKDEETPAVSSTKLHAESRTRLRSSKQKSQQYLEQDFTDSVFVIEGI